MKKILPFLLLACLLLFAFSAAAEQPAAGIDLSADRLYYACSYMNDPREYRDFCSELNEFTLYLYSGDFYLEGDLAMMYDIPQDTARMTHSTTALPTTRKGRTTMTEQGLEVIFDEINTVFVYDDTPGDSYPILATYYPASTVPDASVMNAGPTCPAFRMVITSCNADELYAQFPDHDVSGVSRVLFWSNELNYYQERDLYFSNTWYPAPDELNKYQSWSLSVDENGLVTVHANKKDYLLSYNSYSRRYLAILPPDALNEDSTLLEYYFTAAKQVETFLAGNSDIPYYRFYADKKKDSYLAYANPIFNGNADHIGYAFSTYTLPDDATSACIDELTGSICHTTAGGLTFIEDRQFAYMPYGTNFRMSGKVGSQTVECSTNYGISLHVGKDHLSFYPSQIAYAYPDENQRYDKYTASESEFDWIDNAKHQKALTKWKNATLTMNYEKNTFTLNVSGSKATGPIPWLEVGVYNQKIGGQEFSIYWEKNESEQYMPCAEVIFSSNDGSVGYALSFRPAQ